VSDWWHDGLNSYDMKTLEVRGGGATYGIEVVTRPLVPLAWRCQPCLGASVLPHTSKNKV